MRFTLVALLALVAVASADHSLTVGKRQHGDELLEQKKIDVDSAYLRSVKKTETITAKPGFKITQVEVIDIKKKDKSATPTITAGGPNDTYVTVHFQSASGHGIHYLVKLYGIDEKREFSHEYRPYRSY